MKPVSKTAYYCCGVRMQDAESPTPLIGDTYAKRLLGEEGFEYWQGFKDFTAPNGSNIARHFLIDNHIKALLSKQQSSTIILIGAGLDSRAYRFNSGNWIEIDEPAIINYKNKLLPVKGCPNSLTRIAIDFEKEKLAEKIDQYKDTRHVVIVIEGVLMYLSKQQKQELLKTLTSFFPAHTLLCDLMTKKFFDLLGHKIHKKLVAQGSSFADISKEPWLLFQQYGYKQTAKTSTVKTANDRGLIKFPKLMVNILFKKLFEGYSVYKFVYGG